MLNSDVIFMGIKWRKIVIREWDVVLVMMGMCYIWEEKKEILLDGNIQIFVNKMKMECSQKEGNGMLLME